MAKANAMTQKLRRSTMPTNNGVKSAVISSAAAGTPEDNACGNISVHPLKRLSDRHALKTILSKR